MERVVQEDFPTCVKCKRSDTFAGLVSKGIFICKDCQTKEKEGELIQAALRIKQIEKLYVKAVTEYKNDELIKLLEEHLKLKKEIKTTLMEHHVIKVQNKLAQEIIQKISLNIPLLLDRKIDLLIPEDITVSELTEEEIEELGSNLFYSWFSHYEYITRMYDISALILNCGEIPNYLEKFVSEARNSYVFQNYLAVYSLCRTILEIGVRDMGVRKGFLKEKNGKIIHQKSYRMELIDLIDMATKGKGRIRNKMHQIRKKTNFLIHGRKTVSPEEAKEMLKTTLKVIHELSSTIKR